MREREKWGLSGSNPLLKIALIEILNDMHALSVIRAGERGTDICTEIW